MNNGAFEAIFRAEYGRVLATSIRALGDWQVAEDAVMDAITTALERWPVDGLPDNPGAWLTQAARRRGIDRLRRRQTRTTHTDAVRDHLTLVIDERQQSEEQMSDDRLSLVFTCCHPALAPEARIALTLRYVGGLSTREVARAFLVGEPTMAKRLVRAKHKIAHAGIPYRVPDRGDLPDRLGAVCRVLYLIFNEGYAATDGDELIRRELCDEAIALTQMLRTLMDEPEIGALLALMLLTHSRRDARTDHNGDLVLLQDQDRTIWDHEAIKRGHAILQQALRSGQPGPFVLQACIADLHCSALHAEQTDWAQIAALYAALYGLTGSAVVRLNQAVAVAMASTPAQGLAMLDAGLAETLGSFHRFHAARADLLRRAGLWSEARVAYDNALSLTTNAVERRYLRRQLASVQDHSGSH